MVILAFPVQPSGSKTLPFGIVVGSHHFQLKPATDKNIGYLRELYAESRKEEMQGVPWNNQEKNAFLNSQFTLQHRHFVTHFPSADFLIISERSQPIGRYYVTREDPFNVIDICIGAAHRGRGIGTALLSRTLQEAANANAKVRLHVLRNNFAARRLYERLGFRVLPAFDQHRLHDEMLWQLSTSGAQPS